MHNQPLIWLLMIQCVDGSFLFNLCFLHSYRLKSDSLKLVWDTIYIKMVCAFCVFDSQWSWICCEPHSYGPFRFIWVITDLALLIISAQNFLDILEREPNNVQARHNLCVCYVEQGYLGKAEKCLESVHQLAPHESYILQHLEIVRNRIKQAKQVRAIPDTPQNIFAVDNTFYL